MIGSTLILLALSGQTARPSAVPPTAQPPAKRWLDVRAPGGETIRILGWTGPSGQILFDPAEYPQLVPHRQRTAQPGPSQVFPAGGVVAEKIPTVQAGAEWHGGNVRPSVEAAEDEGDKPPDVFVTVIGEEAQRSAVRANLERSAEYRELRDRMGDRLAVHFYPPDNPMVRKVGLVDGGRPDVIVQDAQGGEVRRWHADPGAGPVVAEVRKLDPAYRPGGHSAPQTEEWATGPAIAGGAFFIGLAILIAGRRRGNR